MKYTATIVGHIWQPGMGLCMLEVRFDAPSDAEAILRVFDLGVGSVRGDFSEVIDVEIIREPTPATGEIIRAFDKRTILDEIDDA